MREALIARFGKPGHHVARAPPRIPKMTCDDGARALSGRGTLADRLVVSPLAEVGEEILRTRAGIKAAAGVGWVMHVWVGCYN